MRHIAHAVSALLSIAMLATAVLADESIDAGTKSAIQDVITKQLDAFAHDDARKAQDLATPGLKEKFPDPAHFIAMVKKNYAPLVQPKSTQFGATEPSPHGPLQTLVVVAKDGTVWTAIYSFEKIDGGWRISGCAIQKEKDQQEI